MGTAAVTDLSQPCRRPPCRAIDGGRSIIGKTNIPIGLRDLQRQSTGRRTIRGILARRPAAPRRECGRLAAGFVSPWAGGSIRVPSAFSAACSDTVRALLAAWIQPSRRHAHFRQGDLAVVGPMARTAAEPGSCRSRRPDETRDGIGYRLALPAPRHDQFRGMRVPA